MRGGAQHIRGRGGLALVGRRMRARQGSLVVRTRRTNHKGASAMGTLYGGHAAKEDDITRMNKEKATVLAYISKGGI